MNKIVKQVIDEFNNVPDLIVKNIKISFASNIYVLYLETVSSSNKINDYILKNLSNLSTNKSKKITNLNSILPGPNTINIDNPDKIEYYLTNGFSVIIFHNEILAIETKADINRSVAPPEVESAVNGPKDAFTENYQINIGLIKRRIKSHNLKTVEYDIGRITQTKIGILYIDNIVQNELVEQVKNKIAKIDVDGIVDSANLAQFLVDEAKSYFPTIQITERPDNAAKLLMEGKIIISVDTSPFALIIPSFFADYLNPSTDLYYKSKNINFLKILRFISFFLSFTIPAIYIALINYNMESIPTELLVSFATQRDGVPFPAIIEALIMLFVCEILRESDLRFPNAYGSAISILGALILGDAAVSAGIVSPIMIITISLTFISSLIFTEVEIVNAIRHYRFILVILAAFYGILGIFFGLMYFFIRINSTESFGKPYFYPIIPFDKTYIYKTLLKGRIKKDNKRSKILTNKNKTKLGEIS